MRNLKRALSLTLASVMLLGMMVIGTSAASYPDVDENDNVEAIEVLQAVGVMQGDDKGNFDPDREVSRNEMAIIMAKLLNLDYNYYSESCPFWDVPDYAKPYVGACYANGIVSGYNANTYGGADTVTAVQAASMMMRALGYFKYDSDYKDGFVISTVRQASSIGLFADINAGQETPLTRNQVAQLALNTLETAMVAAKDNTLSINTGSDAGNISITGGQVDYVIRTSTEKFAKAINSTDEGGNETDGRGGVTIELGEQLYNGALKKDDGDYGNTDVFGRPANHWEYEGKEIGTYAHEADTSFNAKVTSKALYNAVGSAATGNSYRWYVTVDGNTLGSGNVDGDGNYVWTSAYTGATLNANKTDDNDCFLDEAGAKYADGSDVKGTGNGVRTDVYVQGGNDRRVYVSVTHYYAAEVLRVNNANDDDRSITLSDLDAGPVTTADVFETDSFAEDDFVVYSYADDAIQEVFATEKIEGKITQARALENNTNKDGDHFTVDSTKYNYNKTVSDGSPRRLTTENVNNNMVGYLDQYGYVIYIDDAAATYDYAYVLTMGSRDDDWGALNDDARAGADGKTWYARLVLTDGTIVKAETDAKNNNLLHHIVSYSVDSKGIYSLIDRSGAAIAGGAVKIDTGAAGIKIAGNNVVANNNTVFVIADSDESDPDEFNFRIYTGIQNVPDIKNMTGTVSVVATGTGDNSNVAQVVYIQDADVSGTKDVIFIKADENAKFDRTTDASRKYVITAVENGEVVELLVKEGSEADKKLVNEIKKDAAAADPTRSNVYIVAAEYLTRDSNDVVTNVKLYDWEYNANDPDKDDGYYSATGTQRAETGTVGLGATARYGYSDKTIVVRYDVASGDFYPEKSVNGIKDDSDDNVLGIVDTGSLTGVCYLNTTKTGAGVKPVAPKDKVNITVDNKAAGMTVTVNGKADATTTVDKGSEVTIAVAGTVPADKVLSIKIGDQEYTAVGSWKITANANVTVTVELKDKGSQPAIDDGLNIVLAEADQDAGVKITEAHVVTASDPKGTGEKYNGYAVGDLYIAYTLPAGVTGKSSATVALSATQGGAQVTVNSESISAAGKPLQVTKTAMDAAVFEAKGTINLATLIASIKYVASVDNQTGNNKLTFTFANRQIDAANSGTDLKIKIDGLAETATEATVVYKVEGLNSTTQPTLGTAGTDENEGYMVATGLAVAGGTITNTTFTIRSGAKATGPVTVTIKSVTVTKQTGKVELDNSVKSVITAWATHDSGVSASAGLGATVDLENSKQQGFTLASSVEKAVVKYEITGATAKSTNTAKGVGYGEITSSGLTLYKDGQIGTAAAANEATFDVTAGQQVVLKITEVTEVTLKDGTLQSVAGTIDTVTCNVTLKTSEKLVFAKDETTGKWLNKQVVFQVDNSAAGATGGVNGTIQFMGCVAMKTAGTFATAQAASGKADVTITAGTLELNSFTDSLVAMTKAAS